MVIIVFSHSIILKDRDVFLEYVSKAIGKTEQFSFLLFVKFILSYPDNVTMILMKIEHKLSNKS